MAETCCRRIALPRCSWAIAALGAFAGCGDVGGESSDDAFSESTDSTPQTVREFDREALVRAMNDLGYDEDDFSIQDGYVVVDGDLMLDSTSLLAGEYLPKHDPSAPIQKGYVSNKVTVSPLNIELFWSTTNPPDAAMKAAFEYAADQWSYQPSTNIWINLLNSGPRITIHQVTTLPPGCTTGQACTVLPAGGNVTPNIHVQTNPTGVPGCSAWTPSWRRWVALHELGHAIAFEHPGTFTRITGTLASGYPTVMAPAAPLNPACASSVTTLQPDDVLSVQKVYP